MTRTNLRTGTVAFAAAALAGSLAIRAEAGVGFRAAVHRPSSDYEVELWTDRGDDAVYDRGETVSLHFRPTRDSYVVVYGIDEDGDVHLLYPTEDEDPRYCRADRVYDVYDGFLDIGPEEGVVYLQAVACAYPLEPYFPNCFRSHRRPASFWAYGSGDAVEFGLVVGDPYLALAEIRGWLSPRDCRPEHIGFATVSYSCGGSHFYPRYLCADCHYGSWYDPYHDACSVFEIRVDTWWNEPRHAYSCQPRYHYWKRACAPVKYRSWKSKWSSKDRRMANNGATLASAFGGKTLRDREFVRAHGKGSPRPEHPVRPSDVTASDQRPTRGRDGAADHRPTVSDERPTRGRDEAAGKRPHASRPKQVHKSDPRDGDRGHARREQDRTRKSGNDRGRKAEKREPAKDTPRDDRSRDDDKPRKDRGL